MIVPAKDSLDLGIIVSDIKASLDFYQNILGLEFVGITPVWFGTMHRLRFGTSDFKLIDPKTVPPRGTMGLENQLGFRYVTFVIKNISQVCSKLKDKGVEFGSERIPRSLLRGKRANDELLFPKNRRFSAACCGELQFALPETDIRPGVRIAMVKDPDGNIVEFVERS